MLTATGTRITPDNENVPSPYDIAVGMGRICRYGGAIWVSLLAHSVLVGELVRRALNAENVLEADLETWAWALLHDAHEVVMGEIPRPWKTSARKVQEASFDVRLAGAFGLELDGVHREIIHQADDLALRCEAVVMALPEFQRHHAEGLGLDRFPMPADEELAIMRSIASSGLNRPILCTYERAGEVMAFAEVLELIKARRLDDALKAFEGLLDWQRIAR